MRAFVTGAAGFLGGYAVRELVDRGWHVTALVHRRRPAALVELAARGRVTLLRGDTSDLASMRRQPSAPDAIVHCAGRATDVGRRGRFRRANVDSVRNLVRLTEELDAGRLVHVSTTDVYGLGDFAGEDEEELPLRARAASPYPASKIAAERIVRERLDPDRYAIVRPATVWGVGDPTFAPRILAYLRRSPFILHFGRWRGRNRWPLAHVRNVAAALFLAATRPEAAGRAMNVLDEEVTTADEFYRLLAGLFLPGRRLRTVTLPMALGELLGRLTTGLSDLLDLDRPPADPTLYGVRFANANLDFGNARFRRLMTAAGRPLVTREEGLEELRAAGGREVKR
jgi:nucleoside-diphosphate-sugar epimerase